MHRAARIVFLLMMLVASVSFAACGGLGPVSIDGTWVGKGTLGKAQDPFAMLLIFQKANDGSLTAKGQSCNGSAPSALTSWVSYSGQGHNSDIQGSAVDLTLIESGNPEVYLGFHGSLSGSALTLDDETSPKAPVHLTLQQGQQSDLQGVCKSVGTAWATAATATANAEAAAATATVRAAPQIAGTWAVSESNVVCTPGPGEPASVCDGNVANYPMDIQQSGLDLTATFPSTQSGQPSQTLDGSLQGDQFTLSGSPVTFQTNKGSANCRMQYTGAVASSNQLSGTYTSKCEYGYGALILNQTGDWVATRQ